MSGCSEDNECDSVPVFKMRLCDYHVALQGFIWGGGGGDKPARESC